MNTYIFIVFNIIIDFIIIVNICSDTKITCSTCISQTHNVRQNIYILQRVLTMERRVCCSDIGREYLMSESNNTIIYNT